MSDRSRMAPPSAVTVKMSVTLDKDLYADLAALAACNGTSAATHAARLISHHMRALHAERRRDPHEYRLDV